MRHNRRSSSRSTGIVRRWRGTRAIQRQDVRYPNGTGKKELADFATDLEHKRDHALAQDPNFDFSTALFQIAIVLGSVAIVAGARPILGVSVALGLVALVLMVNGFVVVFELPIG